MTTWKPRIGLTADLFDTRGNPLFGAGPLDRLHDAGLEWTVLPPDGGCVDPATVAAFDALYINGSRLNQASMALDGGRLRLVARNGVGFDAVDTNALSKRGVLLTNTPIAVRQPVATMALTFILALSLRLPLKSRLAREGRWSERGDFTGVGLPGRTLGIIGLGGIGQRSWCGLCGPLACVLLARTHSSRRTSSPTQTSNCCRSKSY